MRGFALITSLALLTQCAHRQEATKPVPTSKVEWYIASKEPLTYCPKGYKIPVTTDDLHSGEEFIYLSDQRTRFYIPTRHPDPRYRQQALALRRASLSDSEKLKVGSRQTMDWVASTMIRLTVTPLTFLAFAFGPGSAPENAVGEAMDTIWDE